MECVNNSTSEKHPSFDGSKSILVMDDDREVLTIAEEMLEHFGCKVSTCINGEEAIARYLYSRDSGNPFSGIIMNLTIPYGMGGKEAAEQILLLDGSARLIVSSGHSYNPVMVEYQNYGFCASLPKPYNMSDLAEAVGSL